MQSVPARPDKPALLNPNSSVQNPIVALFQQVEQADLESDFLEMVANTAKSAGCMFLFEIPGSLFDKPEFRAAAVVHEFDELDEHVVFILCHQERGSFEIYDEAEVPDHVMGFISSYAKVLTCLQELESCNQLH